ncbi:MAG: ABC transporter ATP-binding protein/permease [Xylanivirga thermophila]|uniref:ABC transporter ATP-binding protein n=1 Tax=Xylanivirga thermophila TaxID=2496273 RepID=UPI0039F52136
MHSFKDSTFFSFIKERKWHYIIGILLLFLINILQLIVPKITGKAIDGLQQRAITEHQLLIYAGLTLLIAILVFILNYLSRIQIIGSANLYEFALRNKMFRHLLDLSMNFYNKKAVGDIIALSINDVNAIRMAMGRGIMIISDTVFMLIASIYIMSKGINPKLTIIAFIPLPFMVYVMLRFSKIINIRFKAVQESFADLTRKVQENVSGMRIIKSFVQEENEIDNFNTINEDNYNKNMGLVRIQGLFGPLISFISSISYMVVLVCGGNLVVDNVITLGDFIAFNSYLGMIIRPIGFIGMIINFIQRGEASASRINELFSEKPYIHDTHSIPAGAYHNKRLKGKIAFRNLTFKYQGQEKSALKNINLTIQPGKTLAIVGKVGSGKSTLIHLILRLYNPEKQGQLFIDDVDIMDIPLKTLRDNIGYVPQDNFLFSTTIKNNIAFSPRNINYETVEKTAKISQVYDNIIEFPNGFDTMLGERGVNLSGGQKQRISIARALAKNPSIIILDDALSAVDTNTEERILEGLKTFMKGRTAIIIAHRISTIKDADEIVVLDDGRIIEQGTHEELLKKSGAYYEMYQKQLLEEEITTA